MIRIGEASEKLSNFSIFEQILNFRFSEIEDAGSSFLVRKERALSFIF